jgi:hypothetical protein
MRIAATGRRYMVRANEKLTAFLELECPIHAGSGYDVRERTAV